MPTYCYRTPRGKVIELTMPYAQRREREVDGIINIMGVGICKRDYRAELCSYFNRPGTYPMASAAAGVDPSQIAESAAYDRQMGLPTDYTPEGDPIFTSRRHRRRYCRIHGLYDRNAGYGDPSPVNR